MSKNFNFEFLPSLSAATFGCKPHQMGCVTELWLGIKMGGIPTALVCLEESVCRTPGRTIEHKTVIVYNASPVCRWTFEKVIRYYIMMSVIWANINCLNLWDSKNI